jgi:hypothetical protein
MVPQKDAGQFNQQLKASAPLNLVDHAEVGTNGSNLKKVVQRSDFVRMDIMN